MNPFILVIEQSADSMAGSGHQSPGLWRHPDDKSFEFNKIQHWVKLAQLLEKGKFHGMFIADVLVSIVAKACVFEKHDLYDLGCL